MSFCSQDAKLPGPIGSRPEVRHRQPPGYRRVQLRR
jgi:hypothetical protein